MANLIINGGKPLVGEITPSGYKNSIVVIIAASILINNVVKISNVADIADVKKLTDYLLTLGAKIDWNKNKKVLKIDNTQILNNVMIESFPSTMGASNLLFPPLVSRLKEVTFPSKMKGCNLGIRELDDRLMVLQKLGAKLKETRKGVKVSINERFKGGDVWLDYQGVGATENFIMAAVLAKGKSTCTNAASEPQVTDLCKFLVKLGAKIKGIGTNKLTIIGVNKLKGGTYRIVDDYYEVATFLALGAMTNGDIKVYTKNKENMGIILNNFEKLGIKIEDEKDYYRVKPGQNIKVRQPFTSNFTPKIEAAPWPYFPADLTPVFVALSTKAKGTIMHWNKVHEGQHLWITELMKFGTHAILADPHRMIVIGNKPMKPATVYAPYIIRVAIALLMMGASIKGTSVIRNASTIKRAHPDFVKNLQELGADVRWDNSEKDEFD